MVIKHERRKTLLAIVLLSLLVITACAPTKTEFTPEQLSLNAEDIPTAPMTKSVNEGGRCDDSRGDCKAGLTCINNICTKPSSEGY